ncbi:response regulator transcription factor [Paenibacillus flagellatus]|uniref:DNA-binding response regulator n=1 Tax=Paenibacillus flagellatus TaxID=2211139 RepID=A0A2V5K0W4_9BACL|nr:helix-turn-helix domain-containing protein [Paenibacillus flagellatus]PYI52242.1 DNA-binding response regulator [Paenibacillus flagellatus]
MRCMLIDDDIPTVEVLRDMLDWHKLGIVQVVTAHNIQDAKSGFESGVPDLIICDIEMPRGSGLEMIQWVRDNRYDCAFIFFTCHESFEFASTAISYNADSYVVKPFDQQKLEAVLLKAVETIKQKRLLGEYSRLGEAWLKNKDLVEKSFWRDVLFAIIPPRPDLIQVEIRKRELSLAADGRYVLFLVSVTKTEIETEWEDSTFQYALSNLSSEALFKRPNHDRVMAYQTDDHYYHAVILDGDADPDSLKADGERLIRLCRQYLKCVATCYISEEMAISKLANAKTELERLDESNLIFRGTLHFRKDAFRYDTNDPYMLDIDLFTTLFVQKENVQIVNRLKKELEALANQNKLDPQTLYSIRQDFHQVVYALLARNNIQAHRLFEEEVAKRLFQKSDNSVFDFMKWAHFITEKTIATIDETRQSEGVVERVKRFIHENYNRDLNRDDVAATVFLTPDYLAKTFKSETGRTIKEYLNEYRIKVAKRMLVESTASIGYIAMDTGFDSISYFSTVFKKVTGETPNAYREKHS